MNRYVVPGFLKGNVRGIFLIDGFGALCTAFGMGVLWTVYQDWFGMPIPVLSVLAVLALCYALYSFIIYFLKIKAWQIYLRVIAIANLFYIVLSIGLAIYYREQLTILAWGYLAIEALIVLFLVRVEWGLVSGES